ncbi:hypothetical protein SAMN05216583_13024 [Selenomonas sp. KH1T6]|nr:hypothetical protein SAMN05216583_13024 [Selenomonas ruminantium]
MKVMMVNGIPRTHGNKAATLKEKSCTLPPFLPANHHKYVSMSS